MNYKKISKFNKHNLDITILELVEEMGLLKVVAEAEKDGNPVELENPYYFKNPPTKTYSHTTEEAGKKTHHYIEDFDEALRQMVGEAVKLTYK